ncbi:glutathione S-transferase family protein [Marinicella sediminis]|uniref:Glutathione S-transferase family protein n=1 Tax=Marinicella sediminis TaxID=1792834 RepID=A0ABV7J3I2_9GAMM|nr:glutathione S-transferase family protein [Marinicella sediminis]
MKLHYTPKSHFARKNRILIDALGLSVELVDVGNVATHNPDLFAGNPLMKVPTLITDNGQAIFESDHIADYLVRQHDCKDRFQVLTNDTDMLNARAVMNGVMTAEVELVMADRTGIDANKYQRYDKFRLTVDQGMQWLENHATLFAAEPNYTGFHLVSLWDHLVLYQMFDLPYPHLQAHVERLSEIKFVNKSAPF